MTSTSPARFRARWLPWIASFARRFAGGCLLVGTVFYALTTVIVVWIDLPRNGDKADNGLPVPAAFLVPANLGAVAEIAQLLLVIGFPVLCLGVGWRLRGAGIIGALAGILLLAVLPTGDQVALAVDRYAYRLDQADFGNGAPGLALLALLDLAEIVVLGVIGWAVATIRRRPSRTPPGTSTDDRVA